MSWKPENYCVKINMTNCDCADAEAEGFNVENEFPHLTDQVTELVVPVYAESEEEACEKVIARIQKECNDEPDENGNTRYKYEFVSCEAYECPKPGFQQIDAEKQKREQAANVMQAQKKEAKGGKGPD